MPRKGGGVWTVCRFKVGDAFEGGWYPNTHYKCWIKILLYSLFVSDVLKATAFTYFNFIEGLEKCHSFNFCSSYYTVGKIIPAEILKWGGTVDWEK